MIDKDAVKRFLSEHRPRRASVDRHSGPGARRLALPGGASRRSAFVGGVAALLVLAGVVDATVDRSGPRALSVVEDEAAPLSGTSSAWYCPLTPSSRAAAGEGYVTVANVGSTPVTGSATVVPMSGVPVTAPLGLAAGERTVVRPGDLVDAPFSATTVQLNGAGVVVEHTAANAQSISTSRCATQASDSWYFADGSTAAGANLTLALYNPFPEDALADLSFVTSEDRTSPAPLQGVVVPPRSVRLIEVADYLKRRDWITTKVTTRSGRVTVDQLQTNGPNGTVGRSLSVLSPTLSRSWFVPNGYVGPGVTDQLSFFNPGMEEASVSIRLLPEAPEAPSFTILVPSEGRAVVRMGVDQVVPTGGRYSAAIDVTNDAPVAVTRTTAASAQSTGASQGLSLSAPAAEAGALWALGVGATTDANDETVWLANFNDRPVRVDITASGSGQNTALLPITIEPNSRYELPMDEQRITVISDPALLFKADGAVVVGRDLRRNGGPGYQSSSAILLR